MIKSNEQCNIEGLESMESKHYGNDVMLIEEPISDFPEWVNLYEVYGSHRYITGYPNREAAIEANKIWNRNIMN